MIKDRRTFSGGSTKVMVPVIQWLTQNSTTGTLMTQAHPTALDLLCATLSDEVGWRERAFKLGVVRRQGRVDAYALMASVVLHVAIRGPTSIAQIGHVLSQVSGTRLARSSVWDRLTPALRDLIRELLDTVMAKVRVEPQQMPGALRWFRDVIAVDATVVKTGDGLVTHWRGTRQNSAMAAIKVHTWVRALTGELLKVRITAETFGDARALGVDPALRGCLVLVDKAYSSPSLWRRIHNVGGYFLTRLPRDRSPVLARVLRTHRGKARRLVGKTLHEALIGLQRGILDVEGFFECKVRKYNSGANRRVLEKFRLIAVRQRDGRYEVFVTNAPPHMLKAELVSQVYRLRWEVETFFKTAKTGSGLRELPSEKPHIVETLVYACLLRATTSMQALARFRATVAEPRRLNINPGQWHRWWSRQLVGLLQQLVLPVAVFTPLDLATLLADPNVGRPTTRAWFWREEYAT